MKNFMKVFRFELFNYFKNKVFRISTIVLCLLIIIGLSIPTISTAFGKPLFVEKEEEDLPDDQTKVKYGLIIENEAISRDDLQAQLPLNTLIYPDSQEELKEMVRQNELEAGFIVNSETSYRYLVKNTSMSDSHSYYFEHALLQMYRSNSLVNQGIDPEKIFSIYDVPIESETDVLGKDSMKNYLYTYILIFGLYFIIIFYGQLTATSVASEKSNRSMEILVTSTSTESLMFGKVLAGALAGVFQFTAMLLVAFLTYKVNIRAWDYSLDFIFNIPARVLATFSLFGILGYLLFLFIFGVIGALVSRTEDIGTSSTPITLIFIGAFFISMIGLGNPEMLLLKVASFVPLTSFMAMFVRVSMGNVAIWEVAISLGLLAATTFLTGLFGARIYRLGTLMYGDPVKISKAIKLLKNK